MFIEFDSGEAIERVIRASTVEHEDFGSEFEPQVRPADERFGDFQANGVLPFAKKAQLNPRELAQKLIDSLPQTDLWETSIAGPGFINFRLSSSYLKQWTEKFSDSEKCVMPPRKQIRAKWWWISLPLTQPSKCMLDIFVPPS